MPTTSMGPPTKPRKRKAPTLRADAWEPYKARIVELHIARKLPLPEVKKRIEEEFGFTAELRQYRTRISQWNKDKNVKGKEMRAIVRKRQERRLVDVKKGELIFDIRGNKVEPQKIDRWMKRHKVPESFLYAPSPAASTPSDVGCRTVSERGSPVPSPMYSPGIPYFSPAGITSVAHSPPMLSPTLSILSIVQPQGSTFAGQSPAPTYRSVPGFPPDSPSTLIASQSQFISVDSDTPGYALPLEVRSTTTRSIQYRYKQTEEEQLREELLMAETLYGMSHTETLGILSKLGIVLMDQGRYRSAEEMIRKLVKGCRVINGDDDVNTLDALNLLGEVLRYQGIHAKAEKLHRRTFESKRIILGDKHPSTLTSMANLASTYRNQGRWKEAEELQAKELEMCSRVLGEEHPDTLTSMANLASTYRNQGRWKEAEELEVQVMETSSRVLGDEHPDTLTSMANLAHTWKSQSQNNEAILLMKKWMTRSWVLRATLFFSRM
ncbi:TPR-like protein [Mytilinidion resinicola]|uniref:TPR-like protein n=1 Tax=Mytilinidion resinicola TaxID=574789 RepID=A0A6A6YF63_9PEZI|nr:TPR-like protein [Mytilinidion resinicola]KAF2807249.1 TPR-like protein [Mytilinidion resinicola]